LKFLVRLGLFTIIATWLNEKNKARSYPFITPKDYLAGVERSAQLNFIYTQLKDISDEFIAAIKADSTAVLLIDTYNDHGLG
jgi:(E)-4-hydroxy-3-methylbut-2-enyl-diphosphate synthase